MQLYILHRGNVKKANLLNSQFQSVFSCLSPLKLGQLCTKKIHNFFQENIPENITPLCSTMPDIKIDHNGVLKLLSNLKPDKAAGPDSIKPVVLKQLKIEIAPVICLLFEKTLQTGQLPSDWKKAQVCPLFKKGDKTEPSNYRPISLTCILCKVMEHIIASNLSTHLNKHNILYELQHGFCEKRSCETQLIQLVKDLGRQLSLQYLTLYSVNITYNLKKSINQWESVCICIWWKFICTMCSTVWGSKPI